MSDIAMEDWAGEVGTRWLNHLDQFESMIAPVGAALIAKAEFRPGQRIVDVGCGGGANSREIARLVGPSGSVTGVDVAPKLIAEASQRAAGIDNLSFQCLDAQAGAPDGIPFDRLFSRFGVMFFDDTGKAFANTREWVKPGGDIVFACWAPPERNPWMGLVMQVVTRHVSVPQRDPTGPGPFRMADPEATRAMLEAAGYADIAVELWEGEQRLGGEGATPAEAAAFVLSAMSLADPIREAGEHLPQIVRGEIEEAIRPYYRDGTVRMTASAWFVTARNPG